MRLFSFYGNQTGHAGGINPTAHTNGSLTAHNGTVPGNRTTPTPTTASTQTHVCATDAPEGGCIINGYFKILLTLLLAHCF